MNTIQPILQNPALFNAMPQVSNEGKTQQPVDAGHILADFATSKKALASLFAGLGATVTLRHPDSTAASMPAADLHARIEQLAGHDPLQGLARLVDGTEKKEQKKEFDISKLNTSQIAAMFAVILLALQTAKTAERQNQSDMAIVKGQMADGTANAMRAAGQAALSGSISQAAFGLAVSGTGFGMQQKGINRERALLKNDTITINKQNNALDTARHNGAKGGASALDSAMAAQPSRLSTVGGQNAPLQQNGQTVNPRHKAYIEQSAQDPLKKEIGFNEIDRKDKQAKAESTKAKGMLISQMAHPTTGIVGGNTQVIQANENAQQHLHQQAGQVADGLADASNVNSRDFESLIQTMAQKLADIQRAHLDTASMIAGKSV